MGVGYELKGDFIDAANERLFLLRIGPRHQPIELPTVLVVQPFADELNKARRTLACLGRRLALKGWTLAILDLRGTGDSEGQLASVRIAQWLDDVLCGYRYLDCQGYQVRRLLAIRFGALLSCHEHILGGVRPELAVLWEPVTDGKRALRQFLRLKVAADRFRGIDTSVDGLLQQIYQEGVLEVAGYELASEFVRDVMDATVNLDEVVASIPIHLLSVATFGSSSSAAASPNPHMVKTHVTGPRFWDSVEITVAEEFIRHTVAQFPSVG